MNNHKVGAMVLFSAMCVLLPCRSDAQGESSRPPRLAIGNFEYKGVLDLKDGTSAFVDMVSTALIKTRKFTLVERSRVIEALKEMGLGEAGVVDPADCQKLGTLLKADLILFGTISQASLDEKNVAVSGLSSLRQDMRMTVDIRVIDAKTGEIKTAETISKSRTAAKSVTVSGTITTVSASSGIVGDVIRDVANGVVEKLVSNIYPIQIEVVRSDGQVKLNYGDPVVAAGVSYNVCDADGFSVGKIIVTDAQSRNAIGKIVSGTVEAGMVCRKAEVNAADSRENVQDIPW